LAKQVMVVFTDGWSNRGPEPEPMAKAARAAGFELYSVQSEGTPDDEGYLETNSFTLDVIADDIDHVFSDKTFDKLIDRIRERNLKCL
jgi:hypothetical protein